MTTDLYKTAVTAVQNIGDKIFAVIAFIMETLEYSKHFLNHTQSTNFI